MSVKSSVIRCLPNVAVKVPRNCSERTLNIAAIKQFQNGTFEKYTIIVREVVLIQLLSYFWFYAKNKNENAEFHGIFISFKIQLYSKQGSPIFLLFGSWSLVFRAGIISSCLSKVEVFPITPT